MKSTYSSLRISSPAFGFITHNESELLISFHLTYPLSGSVLFPLLGTVYICFLWTSTQRIRNKAPNSNSCFEWLKGKSIEPLEVQDIYLNGSQVKYSGIVLNYTQLVFCDCHLEIQGILWETSRFLQLTGHQIVTCQSLWVTNDQWGSEKWGERFQPIKL